jgi:DNA-directed RNA polymerase specialized sigma24 family protein
MAIVPETGDLETLFDSPITRGIVRGDSPAVSLVDRFRALATTRQKPIPGEEEWLAARRSVRMLATSYGSQGEVERNAECLLGRVEEVRRVLRRKGFSEHAIDHAVTVVYRVAMPYIKCTKICLIENRRAWVLKVAIQAAMRAARRELRCTTVEPATLAASVTDASPGEELFDICEALKQLTDQQCVAVELCILKGVSQRDAARVMGIAVGTLCDHLLAAKNRLNRILAPHSI